MAVIQAQDHVVRFFDHNGRPAGHFGGRGQGPGEFIGMSRLGWYGDTLWVWDGRQQRITLVSPSGALVRTIRLPVQAKPSAEDEGELPAFLEVYPEGLLRGGGLLASLRHPTGQLARQFKDQVSFAKISEDGVIEEFFFRLPIGDLSYHGPEGSARLPFPNPNHWSLQPEPFRLVSAWAALRGPQAGSFQVSAFDKDGAKVVSRRIPFEPKEIPKRVADSVLQRRMAALSPTLRRAFRQHAKVPPIFPPLDGILLGDDGTIWIEGTIDPMGRPYWALEPWGDLIGVLFLPPSERVAVAMRDQIFTLGSDLFDVENILRYSLNWK